MPKCKNMLRTYPRLMKLLWNWILDSIIEIILFSAKAHHCNIANSVVHVRLCFSVVLIYYCICFLQSRVVVN